MVFKCRFLVLFAVAFIAIGVVGAGAAFAATSKAPVEAEDGSGSGSGGEASGEVYSYNGADGSGYIPPSGEQSSPPTNGGSGGTVTAGDPRTKTSTSAERHKKQCEKLAADIAYAKHQLLEYWMKTAKEIAGIKEGPKVELKDDNSVTVVYRGNTTITTEMREQVKQFAAIYDAFKALTEQRFQDRENMQPAGDKKLVELESNLKKALEAYEAARCS